MIREVNCSGLLLLPHDCDKEGKSSGSWKVREIIRKILFRATCVDTIKYIAYFWDKQITPLVFEIICVLLLALMEFWEQRASDISTPASGQGSTYAGKTNFRWVILKARNNLTKPYVRFSMEERYCKYRFCEMLHRTSRSSRGELSHDYHLW